MNWDRYNELVALRNSGDVESATADLAKLAEAETDVAIKAVVLMEIANSLRTLKRFSDSRDKLREANKLVGPKHPIYPRIALALAKLDIDKGRWKSALRKLDTLAKEYDSELKIEENTDVKEEV